MFGPSAPSLRCEGVGKMRGNPKTGMSVFCPIHGNLFSYSSDAQPTGHRLESSYGIVIQPMGLSTGLGNLAAGSNGMLIAVAEPKGMMINAVTSLLLPNFCTQRDR